MKAKPERTGKEEGAAGNHRWRFARSGGVDQVVFRDGQDIARLRELDLKLWTALSMPVRGVDLDPRTAALLDVDGDGKIRPQEILAAVDWASSAFKDLGELMTPGDSVPLGSIRDPGILDAARLLLANLGKPDADRVSMADVADREKSFAGTLFNGDGVVPPEAADDEATAQAIRDILAVSGSAPDLGGKPGIDADIAGSFFARADAWLAWRKKGEDPAVSPLAPEASAAAWAAVEAVRAKVDDYFTRCRLAAYDPRGASAVNRDEADFKAVAGGLLSPSAEAIAAFPLAPAAAGKPLPLEGAVNPAWASAVSDLARLAVKPVLGGDRSSLSEEDWAALLARFEDYSAWTSEEPGTTVSALGAARLAELEAGGFRDRIAALIARDAALAGEAANIALVEKLVRFRRDLFRLLTNYVNFSAFYRHQGAVFQAGTLYLDARACTLCVEVLDESRQAALAGLSGAFLAYCDLSRPGGLRKKIVAAFTDGDSDNLMAGRNGVFIDREGLDWDATVTRLISNPISVREAFWLPYKKLARMIEEQVAKRAQAGESKATAQLAETAGTVANADKAAVEHKPAEPAKKLDLGTIALLGTAIGGVSALVAGFLQTLFGLGIFLPLGVLGILLLISGPSMILASLKLRKRNLAPILDANGWAINTKARINIPFGASLTSLAVLPPGTLPSLPDPFSEKKKPWGLYILLLVLALAAAAGSAWRFGWADRYLPEAARYSTVIGGKRP